MNISTPLKGMCIVALLTASASVTALDLKGAFGKKKEEPKDEAKTETVKTLKPKLKEQEAKIEALKKTYSKKDDEAGSLMTKLKGYGTQLNEMDTKYGNVSGKLDTYLCGKYPDYKKTSDTYSALKQKYDSLKGGSSAPKTEKKKSSGFGALGDMAKSTLNDTSADTVKALKKNLKKEETKLATMRDDLSKETPEGQQLKAECTQVQEKMATITKEQESTDLELTTLLKKRYPDFKAVTDDYDLLKKTYDELKAAKK